MNYTPIGCNFPSWFFNYTNDLHVKKSVDSAFMAIRIEENNEISYGEEIILECANEGKLISYDNNLELPFQIIFYSYWKRRRDYMTIKKRSA